MTRDVPIAPVLALFLAPLQQPDGDALPAANPAVTRAELEHHVRVLASDAMGGRAPLTAGADRSAAYLARALEAAGVEPAGDDGGYFQVTGLKRQVYASLPRLLFTDESGAVLEARYGVDFTLSPRGLAHSTEKLPLRFFYDYNHARMPLTGNPEEAIYFSATRADKERILAKKGIESLADWGLEFSLVPGEAGLNAGRPKESFPPRVVEAEEGCERVEIRGPLRADFERRKYTHAQLQVEETVEPFVDRNVVGRIRGVGTPEHPELAGEVVILSANYDRAASIPGPGSAPSIQNGANGNASGCAALLELAQAFAAGAKPARTLVFLFTTSEEGGNAGSQHYLEAPPEPLAKTVLALCLERLGRPDPLVGAGHLWLSAAERSNLAAEWASRGLPIAADPRPEQMFARRLTARGFVAGGVLAHSLSSFDPSADPGVPDRPDGLDYAHLETAARAAFAAAGALADGSLLPKRLGSGRFENDDQLEAVRARLREQRRQRGDEPDEGEPK